MIIWTDDEIVNILRELFPNDTIRVPQDEGREHPLPRETDKDVQ